MTSGAPSPARPSRKSARLSAMNSHCRAEVSGLAQTSGSTTKTRQDRPQPGGMGQGRVILQA